MKYQNLKMWVLILFGPPGAGKGVQAVLLSEKLNLYHLETSKLLERQIMKASKGAFIKLGEKKYFLAKEKRLWKTGKLFSPELVSFFLKNKIRELAKLRKSLLIEGTPRSITDAKEIIPLLKKLYGLKNIKIIFLEINPNETLWRNSRRRICQLMRHSILYSSETKNLKYCPLDGSKLLRRKGLDDPKTIKIRIEEYNEKTLPLLNYFKKEKLEVKKIDGSPAPAKVFDSILKALTGKR